MSYLFGVTDYCVLGVLLVGDLSVVMLAFYGGVCLTVVTIWVFGRFAVALYLD